MQVSGDAEQDQFDMIEAYAEARCWNLLGCWPTRAPDCGRFA